MQNQTTSSSLLSRLISRLNSRSTSTSDTKSDSASDLPSTTLSDSQIDSHMPSRYMLKNIPWAAFGMVLLVHVVVLWWVMGVYFGRPQDDAAQPIFVTLVVDEGAASESSPDTLSDITPDTSPPTFTDRSEAVAPEVNKPLVSSAELAAQQSADIAEEKPATQRQDPPVAPKRTSLPARQQPVSPAPSVMPVMPTPAVSELSGSGSAAGSASNFLGEKPTAGATGPRVVTRVEYLGDAPRPVYPTLARSRKQQGKVIVRVLISPQGLISSITVQQSSGFEALDDAAIRAFAAIRFKPYSENGVPLERIADIPIEFLLRN